MAILKRPKSSDLNLGDGKAVLLVSGGPDSATMAYWAKELGYDMCAIHFKQGLKTDRAELKAADQLSKSLGIRFEVLDISQMIGTLGGLRAMIHSEVAVLRFGTAICLAPTIAYANTWGADTVLLGLHLDDTKEGEEYQRAFLDPIQEAAKVALGKPDFRIKTPFLEAPKSEVLALGIELGVPFEETWSCINAGELHCGLCGACRARQQGFQDAGIVDPTRYEEPAFAVANG